MECSEKSFGTPDPNSKGLATYSNFHPLVRHVLLSYSVLVARDCLGSRKIPQIVIFQNLANDWMTSVAQYLIDTWQKILLHLLAFRL